jgi:hypothetical protein
MRHIHSLSKAVPAPAVESGLLTKSTGGVFGANELGDIVLGLAAWLDQAPVIGPWLVLVPAGFRKGPVV